MNLANTLHEWRKFFHEEDGATAVEYAVMLALIVAVCAAAVVNLADATNQSFTSSQNAIQNGS